MSNFDKRLEEELKKLEEEKKKKKKISDVTGGIMRDLTDSRFYMPTSQQGLAEMPMFTAPRQDVASKLTMFTAPLYNTQTNASEKISSYLNNDDDIAPTKTDLLKSFLDERNSGKHLFRSSVQDEAEKTGLDFFQRSKTFDDGYDFGDVTKTILGTVADLNVNAVKGVVGLAEGVVDLAGYGVAGVADLLGKDEFANALKKSLYENTVDTAGKPIDDYLDKYSILGRTSDSIGRGIGQVGAMIATGGLASAAGLGAAGTTAVTSGLMGFSSMGSGMGEAYQGGATDGEAVTYGLIAGASDAISELIFGGLGKSVNALGLSTGLSSADDILAKKVSKMFSSQMAKNFAEYGIKAGAEGFEEVLAGVAQAAGKKATYMSEEEFGEILKDENLLEQFVVGAVTSGIAQANGLHIANKTDTDFVTGYNQNEQSVIDKVVKDRIAEAEQDGKKVTGREKTKIYDSVVNDMEKGYISTDTIEEVLGGDNYKAYQDTIKSEDDALAELAELYEGDELKAETEKFLANSKRSEAAKNLSDSVFDLVKSSRLGESYREKARRGQKFEADLSKYDEKQRATVQKAVESGILNNTNRTHEMVDIVAKISADKGVLFDFTNNDKLKDTIYAVDGKTVNGFVTKDGITINVDSKKYINTIVGHEITHVLEGTDLYDTLQETLFEYAKKQNVTKDSNEYKERLRSLYNLYKDVDGYKGVEGFNAIKRELTADLVGDYLFTDSQFINNLSTNHRNVFQKIYDEVKYLVKVATAGSKEARELERVKKVFDEAYRATGNAQASTKFSLSDTNGRQLSNEQKEYFKDSKVVDENGNLKVMYHGTSNGGHTVFDPWGKGKYGLFGVGIYFTDSQNIAQSYTKKGKGTNPQVYESYLNIKNPMDMDAAADADAWAKAFPDAHFPESGTNEQFYRAMEEYFEDEGFVRWEAEETAMDALQGMGYDGITHIGGGRVNADGERHRVYIAFDSNQIKSVANTKPTGDPDIRYSLGAEETNQKIGKIGLQYDSANETVSYSLSSLEDAFHYNDSEADYIASRLEYETALAKSIAEDKENVTQEEMDKAKRYLDSLFLIHDMIAKDRDRLDYEAAVGKSSWVSNAEYGGSIDFSTLCAKRRLFTGTFDAIQNEMPDTVLDENDFLQIRNMLLEKELESPCSMCYVEGSRAKHGVYVAKFLKEYKKTNPEWVPQIADFTSTTRLEQTRINHKEAYQAYIDAMNSLSQRKPKEASVRTDYKGEILRDFKDTSTVAEKNKNGGVRFNSFSDFEIIHAIDCMQVITDMARVGLNGQAYTKVKEFAEAFGNTGLKINLSLVAKDVGADGKLIFDETNGMKHAEAMDIRNRYSENVGTVIVVFNENQLKAALADNTIDYVLPFHRSQWKKSQYTMMGLPTSTKDFTNYQNDRIKNPNTGRDVKLSKIKHISQYTNDITGETFEVKDNIMPNQYWDYNASPRANAQRYLDYINANGMTPKFNFLLSKDANGNWTLPADEVGNGYYKLLIDFKMYNNDGWGSPQNPVVPEFNMPYIQKMLEDYKGGHKAFPVAHDVVSEFVAGKKSGKFSLSENGEQPRRYGNYNVSGQDIALETAPVQEEVAPVQEEVQTQTTEELFPDNLQPVQQELENLIAEQEDIRGAMEAAAAVGDYATVNQLLPEYDEVTLKVQELQAQESERTNTLTEADMPPVAEAQYPGEASNETVDNPFHERDWNNMGNRKVKAYMYENPEVKPFFQDEALALLSEFKDTTRGERFYNDQAYLTGGNEEAWTGVSRHTSKSMETLLDSWDMSYADIEKGLNAIIEDNGAENIAAAKKIEFMLNDRLLNGYTDFYSNSQVPPNQDYINLLAEKQINEYSEEAFARFMETADQYAPPETDIAPLSTQPVVATETATGKGVVDGQQTVFADQDVAPTIEYEAVTPKRTKEPKMVRVDKASAESQRVAQILSEEPTPANKKSRAWARFKANVLDKGAVFEDLSLKRKNRSLMGKWNYILYSEARAQRLMGNGAEGVKSLNAIREEVDNSGKTQKFYEYLYHWLNVDRMTLENRYEDTPNKAVFGDSVTADMSRATAVQLGNENPEFRKWAQEVYKYNSYLRDLMVDKGVISQETADLWAEMYPHYVPIRREGDTGLDINVPLDTGRTGVNAPVKRATGGSRNILPLFDTMAQRTVQTYKAIAKNSFGVELKNTLGTTISNDATNVDDIIDSIDAQEGLLQEGKNGRRPTFTVFEDGEKVTFEITDDMYDALKPVSEGMAYTNKFLNTASNLHRGVLTEYNPVFMLTNAIKDVQDVLINSQHPAKTYAKIPEAYAQMFKKGYWYNEYMENGGEQNTYFDNETNTFKTENKGIRKLLDIPPLSTISKLNNFIEMTPRLAEYIASREAGRSVEVAMLDAARVTTNFSAGGDLTKLLNRNGATFLNASIQGAMQQVRNVREAKANGMKGWVNLATKFAIAGLPALILNNLVWDDDEEYEELADYVKQNYYIVGKYGDGKFIRIPKGRTMAVIQSAFDQISNAATGNDEVDLKSFLELAVSNLAPNNPIEDNILAPIVQVAKNETWYGEDLVPTRLQDLPAAEQYDESTDSVSKWLGEKLNISPYKINYLLDQYTGGVGDTILPMLTPEAESGDNSFMGNVLAPLKSKFTTDSTMNNQNVSDFYDTKDELTTNAKASTATDEDVLMSKYMNSINADLAELYAMKREYQNSSFPDDVKNENVRIIQEQIVNLTKESLNTYKDVNISGDHAIIGDRHFERNEDGEWQKLSAEQVTKYEVTSAAGDSLYATDGTNHYRWYEPGEDAGEDAKAGWRKVTEKELERQNEVTSGLGITPEEYWGNKEEYSYAYDNPENYAVAKAVGGYDAYKSYSSDLYDIKADKDSDGKSISGSRKEKVFEYIDNLDAEYGEKIILFKSEYPSDDTYNYEIIDYLNSREDISYSEMVTILKKLNFTVLADGTIQWD